MMRKVILLIGVLGTQSSYAMQDGPYNDRSPWNGAPGDFGNMNMPGEPMNNLPATLNRPERNWHHGSQIKEYDFQKKIIDVTDRDKSQIPEKTENNSKKK